MANAHTTGGAFFSRAGSAALGNGGVFWVTHSTSDPIEDVEDPIEDVDYPIEDNDDAIEDVDYPIEDIDDTIKDNDDPIEDVDYPIEDIDDPIEDAPCRNGWSSVDTSDAHSGVVYVSFHS